MYHKPKPVAASMARMLRLPEVKHLTGLSRSAIYEMVKRGEFPGPVRLGARAVGWLSTDVAAWMDGRIANTSNREKHGRDAK